MSAARGLHPGAWLLWASCGGLAAVLTTNPFYLAVACAASWLVYTAHRKPGPQLRSFRIFVVFGLIAMATRTALVLVDPLLHVPITTSSVALAVFEGARIATLLCIFGTFNSVSDPHDILRLSPRRLYEPMLAVSLALSLAPRTIASVGEVREAQRIRGANTSRWRTLPALMVPVLETGMEEAVTLAESMDARGHGRGRRTSYRRSKWDASSYLVAGSGIVVGGAFLWGSVAGRGDLITAMPPLAWPGVDLALVVATALLAAPAVLPAEGNDR
jgi:energy-coupling factor transport system permease protein